MAVGINIDGVNKIKSALNEYCQNLNNHNVFASNTKIRNAFEGSEIENQITNYSKAMTEHINIASRNIINAFDKKMTTVINNYMTHESKTTVIKNAAEQFKS